MKIRQYKTKWTVQTKDGIFCIMKSGTVYTMEGKNGTIPEYIIMLADLLCQINEL